MVDFKNNTQMFKMKEVEKDTFSDKVSPYMIDGEETVACYKALRDYCVFTNKRVIVVDVQGIIGKKQDYSSLPYNKIQAFSVKTAGVLDIDTDIDIVFTGLGLVHLEFSTGTNVAKICRLISEYALK